MSSPSTRFSGPWSGSRPCSRGAAAEARLASGEHRRRSGTARRSSRSSEGTWARAVGDTSRIEGRQTPSRAAGIDNTCPRTNPSLRQSLRRKMPRSALAAAWGCCGPGGDRSEVGRSHGRRGNRARSDPLRRRSLHHGRRAAIDTLAASICRFRRAATMIRTRWIAAGVSGSQIRSWTLIRRTQGRSRGSRLCARRRARTPRDSSQYAVRRPRGRDYSG